MSINTPEGIMLDGSELVAIIHEMGVEIKEISVESIAPGEDFYREWIDELGAETYAITIEHDYDEDSLFSDPDHWQDALAAYVSVNHPEVEIDDDGWLPNVVFHV